MEKINLNPEQQLAVDHFEGPCLVVASPGSGKTRCIIERIARLIEKGVNPHNILSITFTNKAANEMRERATKRIGAVAQSVYISTFHAFCAAIIRKYGSSIGYAQNTTILDEDDQISVMRQVARQKGHEMTKDAISVICEKTNTLREEMASHQEWEEAFKDRTHELDIAKSYIERILIENTIDFSGLLSETIRLFEVDKQTLNKLQQRFQFIQIDETQDCNNTQHKIAQDLASHGNLYVISDLDQCQPPGTLVETIQGAVPIEDLDQEKHKLVSFSRRQGQVVGRTHGYSFIKNVRQYYGTMFHIITENTSTKCTGNHKWTVRFDKYAMKNRYATYIMRQGDKRWRIGRTMLFRSTGTTTEGVFGPPMRARQEKADSVWVLRVFDSVCEAQAYEQLMSIKYGLPTLGFESATTSGCWDIYEKMIFNTEDICLMENAKHCLEDHNRSIDYPLWRKREVYNDDYGVRIPLLVEGCNLIPEIMRIPVPIDKSQYEWTNFQVETEKYSGNVYSLDVEKYEHYIADGIITHNSIYGWRGAKPECVIKFVEEKKARVIILPKNYRSTPEIIKIADNLIKNNKNRHYKFDLITDNESGDPVEVYGINNPDAEGEWVAGRIRSMISHDGFRPEDFAVLYRLNSMSRSFEKALVNEGIKYTIVGGMGFYDRMEIKDAHAMLRFYINNNDSAALSRFINCPKRSIGEVSLGKIELFAKEKNISLRDALERANEIFTGVAKKKMVDECNHIAKVFAYQSKNDESLDTIIEYLVNNLGYLLYLSDPKFQESYNDRLENLKELYTSALKYTKQNGNDINNYLQNIALMTSTDKKADKNCVTLMTMHASKGLEFPVVFVPCVNDKLVPHSRAVMERADGLEEERRLFYVSITRSKKKLFLSYHLNEIDRKNSKGNKNLVYHSVYPSVFLKECGFEYSDIKFGEEYNYAYHPK